MPPGFAAESELKTWDSEDIKKEQIYMIFDDALNVFGLIVTQSFLKGLFWYESRIVRVFLGVSGLCELNNQSLKAVNPSTPCFVVSWQSQSRA